MSRSSEPITITLPDDLPPEQAWPVHEILDDLPGRIEEAHYRMTVQHWLVGEDADDDPFTKTQLVFFDTDFDDPLPF